RRRGVRRAPPSKIFDHFASGPCDVVASCFGFEGLKSSVLSACSSGTVAIGYAADAIVSGQLDVALAGGSDVLCRLTFSGFNALRMARVPVDAVDHINAHGTATPQNDQAEARALRLTFGDRTRRLPVTSIKSMIGHCLSAAGAIEAATLALSIARGIVPPTVG